MWTDADRSRHRQAGNCLPNDLSDAEWGRLAAPWCLTASASASIGSNLSGQRRLQRPPGRTRRRRAAAAACRDRQTSRRQFTIHRPVERTFSWFGRNRRLAKITRTSLIPSRPSLHSLASSSPSGGSPGRRLLSQALSQGPSLLI
jgi:hypothetical protein